MEYGATWKDAVEQVRQIDQDDRAFVDAGLNTDRRAARAAVAELYVRYVGLVFNSTRLVGHLGVIARAYLTLVPRFFFLTITNVCVSVYINSIFDQTSRAFPEKKITLVRNEHVDGFTVFGWFFLALEQTTNRPMGKRFKSTRYDLLMGM